LAGRSILSVTSITNRNRGERPRLNPSCVTTQTAGAAKTALAAIYAICAICAI